MGKYIWKRILKSIVSLMIVVSVVIVMLYKMTPMMKAFQNDSAYNKMSGDLRTTYRYTKLEELGYLDYVSESDMTAAFQADGDTQQSDALSYFEDKGYTIGELLNGTHYGYREYSSFELIWNFWSHFLIIDNPNAVKDDTIDHKLYFGTTSTGAPALMCSGCTYKYQWYFSSSFPFIHSNWIHFNFGQSYPTKAGTPTTDVIFEGQGSQKQVETTFPSGVTQQSALLLNTCKYKETLDALDQKKFTDHYADCKSRYESPSMVNTSYIFGIIALIISYAIGYPAGMGMARNKDKFWDKVGTVYINLLIAVPSLAFIFFVREIGNKLGLPDVFPQYGFKDIRSYIIPIVILAMLGTPGLMTWVRRYMLDQASSDYVKFARAKGLSEREIYRKHVMRNAIIPLVNGIPSSIILQISGAVVTESAFAIPGMGKMLPDAINKVNNNMVITLVFIYTALSIAAVLLGDILMVWVDPRIKLAAKGD